jgi:hypothetical protein
MINPSQDNKAVFHCLDYIDNMPGSKNQTMHKAYTSEYLKELTDLDIPLVLRTFDNPNDAYGDIYFGFTLFKKPLENITGEFELGNYLFLDSQNYYINDIDLSPPNHSDWVTFGKAVISFYVNGIKYETKMNIQGKELYADFNGIVDLTNDTTTYLNFNYDNTDKTVKIYAIEKNGKTTKIDNLKIEVLSYA